MQTKHSFVILAYKESPYLEECINSLLEQTIQSEIVLATSTPNNYLEKIAKKYKLNLKINTGEKGLAPDWNFALKQSRTEYTTLAHQDDIYLPKYTEEMLKNLEKYPDFSIKFCDYQEIYHGQKETKLRTWTLNLFIKRVLILFSYGSGESLTDKVAKNNFLRFGSPIPCPSVLYHTSKIKGFSFSPDFKINVDWIAWIDFAKNFGPFLKTSHILMRHRIHAESETSRGLRDNVRQNEDLICFEKLWPKAFVKPLIKLYSLSYWTN